MAHNSFFATDFPQIFFLLKKGEEILFFFFDLERISLLLFRIDNSFLNGEYLFLITIVIKLLE